MMLLVSKENYLVKKDYINFIDLKDEKFIMLSPEYKSRQLGIECCLKSGFKPNIVFETSQLDIIIELVSLNKGIAVLPECILVNATKINDKVSVISFQHKPLKVEMGFIISKFQNINHIEDTLIKYTLNFFAVNKI